MHLCEVRNERDVDWVVGRVQLGDRVVVQIGGLRRPRRQGLKPGVALCHLESRLTAVGGQLEVGHTHKRVHTLIRGRVVVGLPPEDRGPGTAGVREPRRPTPQPWEMSAARPVPGS